MTSNLKELKDKLYEAFNEAADWPKKVWSNTETYLALVENRKAMAQLAQAIVVVESKIEEREQGPKGFGLKG